MATMRKEINNKFILIEYMHRENILVGTTAATSTYKLRKPCFRCNNTSLNSYLAKRSVLPTHPREKQRNNKTNVIKQICYHCKSESQFTFYCNKRPLDF